MFDVELGDIGQQDRGGGVIGAEFLPVQFDDFDGEGQRLLKFTLRKKRGVLVVIIEKGV